jgi:hypothetical protein
MLTQRIRGTGLRLDNAHWRCLSASGRGASIRGFLVLKQKSMRAHHLPHCDSSQKHMLQRVRQEDRQSLPLQYTTVLLCCWGGSCCLRDTCGIAVPTLLRGSVRSMTYRRRMLVINHALSPCMGNICSQSHASGVCACMRCSGLAGDIENGGRAQTRKYMMI